MNEIRKDAFGCDETRRGDFSEPFIWPPRGRSGYNMHSLQYCRRSAVCSKKWLNEWALISEEFNEAIEKLIWISSVFNSPYQTQNIKTKLFLELLPNLGCHGCNSQSGGLAKPSRKTGKMKMGVFEISKFAQILYEWNWTAG